MNHLSLMGIEQRKYPAGFFQWLIQNQHIWNQFELHSLTMARKRLRYSARTIIEVMRWNSDIRQVEKTFKLSNNMVPGLARLFMHTHGEKFPKFYQIME